MCNGRNGCVAFILRGRCSQRHNLLPRTQVIRATQGYVVIRTSSLLPKTSHNSRKFCTNFKEFCNAKQRTSPCCTAMVSSRCIYHIIKFCGAQYAQQKDTPRAGRTLRAPVDRGGGGSLERHQFGRKRVAIRQPLRLLAHHEGVSGMKIELVRRLRRSTDRYNLLAIYTAPPIGSSRRTFLIALTASKVRRGVRRSSSPRSGTPYRSGARDHTESRCMTMQSPVIRPEPCSP
jgi:hypothetical protein